MLVKNAASVMSLADRMDSNRERYQSDDMGMQYRELVKQNILSVFHDNKEEDFDADADMLINAHSRYVIGLRGCKGVRYQFGRLLAFMLPNVRILANEECLSVNSLQDATADDVVIMFVFSRFYKIDLSYMKLARERGCRIILVVNDDAGLLSRYADVILMVGAANLSFFNSAIGADVVCEYLLNMVSERVDFKDRIAERDEITEYQRL